MTNVSIRTNRYTDGGSRIWATEAQALAAQKRMAEALGIFSGATKTPDGWVLLHDPWPELDIH